MNEIQPGDIIQITDADHKWYPCLLIVSEVKSWGVQADAIIPSASGIGIAPIRIEADKYEKVGVATITTEEQSNG